MARELVDGVWLLELGLRVPLDSNAYLLDEAALDNWGDEATQGESPTVTLVDTGLFVNYPSLRRELAAAGYGVADIDRVLLTHYDLDHTGGLHRIGSDLTAPVYLGRRDARMVTGDEAPRLGHPKGLFHRVARRVAPLPDSLAVEAVDDGDRVGRFTAYHTPGHNPGHTVYVHDSGVAFLGDLVWEEDGELTTPIWFDSYDMNELRASVREFAARDHGFEVACMGHGTPLVTDGAGAVRRLAERL